MTRSPKTRTFRSMSEEDRRRPAAVSSQTFAENWRSTFGFSRRECLAQLDRAETALCAELGAAQRLASRAQRPQDARSTSRRGLASFATLALAASLTSCAILEPRPAAPRAGVPCTLWLQLPLRDGSGSAWLSRSYAECPDTTGAN